MLEIKGKAVDKNSIEIDGIDTQDYPDFCDSFISDACFNDGTKLTEDEVIELDEKNYGLAQEMALESLF